MLDNVNTTSMQQTNAPGVCVIQMVFSMQIGKIARFKNLWVV